MRISKKIAGLVLSAVMLAVPITASANMNGIDISNHQRGINVDQVEGLDFVIIKATEGRTYRNPDMSRTYRDARADGLKTGLYHYASGGNAVAEAEHFVNTVGDRVGENILVLDYEGTAANNGVGWAMDFMDAVYNMTGVKPVIYMSRSVIQRYDWTPAVNAGYKLWVAAYYRGYNPIYGFVNDPPIYGSLGEYANDTVMYQYTSTGRLSGWGGNLDLDVFYGNESDWDALAGVSATYTVRSGDCLSVIGARLGVSWQSIAQANGITSPYTIYPGQVIRIPGGTYVDTYTVRSGDCLSVIGERHGIDWRDIARKNGISSPYTIYTGQVIRL